MDLHTQKVALRKLIKQRLSRMTSPERQRESARMEQMLLRHPKVQQARVIMLYAALPDEVYTSNCLISLAQTKTVLLPVVRGDLLEVRQFSTLGSMSPGAYNISEPQGQPWTDLSRIDLVIVPGVAFDRSGNRLGRGRGYYDRFLSQPTLQAAYKLGLCYPCQLCDRVPAEPCDICMDEVLCDTE